MAFFCRINQSKLKSLSDQFKRHYFKISYAASLDSPAKHVSGYVERIIPRRPADFADNLRFYAAPVQFQGKAKKEEKDTSGPRLNDKIKADFVRLVSDDGHTILPLHEALECARQLKLDLVEVQQKANPPVCKIMDFHRQKYEQKIREKDRVKSKAEVSLKKGGHKEVRFTGKTILHISEVEVRETKMMGSSPIIIVAFQTQQVYCVRDAHGSIREGGKDTIHTVYYAWAMQMLDPEEVGEGASHAIWRVREMQQFGVQALI